ncbi:MAG: hypothetical protein AAFX94_06260 [Myxococcota bacterium]
MQNNLRWMAMSLLLVSFPAYATTVMPLDAEGLARHSTVVGVAQVLRTRSVRTPKAGWVTLVELEFYQGLKGVKAGENLLIQTAGAILPNGMELRVDGAPRFAEGQLVLGFFHEHGGVLKPTAMSLGVLRVINDSQGVFRVVQQTDGLTFARVPNGPEPLVVPSQPLDDVVDMFEDIIAAQGGAPVGDGVAR